MSTQNVWGRRRFLKTLTSGLSLLPAAAPLEVASDLSRQKTLEFMAPTNSPGKIPMPIYDPLLDPKCRLLPAARNDTWPAHWIWYPGQLTSHLHARTVQASMVRCAQVGYPSSFRQPLSFAYFRKRATLRESSQIRWAGPLGRIRFILNGAEADITLREKMVPAGPVEIVIRIDFARGLPCLLLDGGKATLLSTDESWEASVDFRDWVEVESD